MLGFLRLSFFMALCLMSISVNAKTVNLSAHETKVLTNYYLWTYHTTCNIKTDNKNDKIQIKVVKNSGTVNGKILTSGQSKIIDLKSNSHIYVSAESGTEINLINLGDSDLQASCST